MRFNERWKDEWNKDFGQYIYPWKYVSYTFDKDNDFEFAYPSTYPCSVCYSSAVFEYSNPILSA